MELAHEQRSTQAAATPSDSSSPPPPASSSPAPPSSSSSSSSSPSSASSPRLPCSPPSPQAAVTARVSSTEQQGVGRDQVADRRRPACRGITPCRTAVQSNNHTQLNHPPGVSIKEEPHDEIKDYAETTMNELLGWYGYNDVIHKEDTLNLDLKRFAPNGERPSCLDRSRTNSPGDAASQRAKDSLTSATDCRGRADKITGGSNSLASKNETIVAALSTSGKKVKDELKKTSSAIDSRDDADPLSTSLTSSDGNMADSDGAATCEPVQSLTCAWCQKRAGEKPLSFEMDDGVMKVFCTDLCFTLCRRASFKKSKVCDWCKKVKNTVSYVDFQDGEQQLQFCGEQCLNQYKMNIFCKETQSIKSQLGSVIVPPPDGAKQIIITPDLWTEQQQQQQQQQQQRLEDESRQNDARDPTRSSRSVGDGENLRGCREEKESSKRLGHSHKGKPRTEFSGHQEKRYTDGHLPYKNGKLRYDVGINGDSDRFPIQRNFGNIPSLEKSNRSPKRDPAVYSSTSSHRPSSKGAAESHQPKVCPAKNPTSQDGLKLNHSADGFVYPPYSLTTTSPSSELSAATRSTTSTAPPVSLSTTSGLAGGQLLGCLGPAGLQPWMYNPLLASGMAGFPGFGLPGLTQPIGALPLRQPGSSLSMASPPPAPPPPPTLPVVVPAPNGCPDKRDAQCSQTPVSQPQPAPLPPRPPFTGTLPPNATNLFGMLPPPPGMPGLFGMGGPGFVPPIGNLNGLLPPNTLMVPYPVVVPLPIPLPLPIPIPVPCDKSGNPMLPIQVPSTESSPLIQNAQIKQEDPDVDPTSLYPEGARNTASTSYGITADLERTSCANTGVDRIFCACCNRKPSEGHQGRRDTLQTDTPPPLHSRHSPSHMTRTRAATSCPNVQNDAIDLSKDRKRKFDGDFDVNRNNTATSTVTSTLTMSPPSASSSESEGSSQLTLAAAINVRHPVESVYSARRSLILDAPSMPKDRHRESPNLDKRLYVAGLNKEHTYGKRRCMRPRVRTK